MKPDSKPAIETQHPESCQAFQEEDLSEGRSVNKVKIQDLVEGPENLTQARGAMFLRGREPSASGSTDLMRYQVKPR